MERLDARGLSCPEPVILLRKALRSRGRAYEMVVDDPVAKENVIRCAQHEGYTAAVSEQNGEYTLTITK